jgi:hypothetical protein
MVFAEAYYPCRVKTETSFNADDPWNQNRRATFALDSYVLAPRGAHRGAGREAGARLSSRRSFQPG